ncbi:exonuclease domain-containing protein [Bacillus carboniphilus]|uniref:Exonuclease domain-containing protein n=1 Tax=Bacillus carboniphilus TaxID=86663 RepID=A0ABY9JYS7_9BACI|nr:exonuclease domain-containing protein [Bacillus carboniphilus]WLR43712.1 exonuclease domain-containing protein [Bacillus carboniphilus]
MNNRYVVVDIETTGNSAKDDDRIIQFAAVVVEKQKIVKRVNHYINPLKEIPSFIQELTGISEHMVYDAPTFDKVANEIHQLFKDAFFVAHNVFFDLTFLQEEFKRAGYQEIDCPIIDTVELTRIMEPTLTSYKLADLSAFFSFTHEFPHRADSDAYVTAELLLYLLGKLSNQPCLTLQRLHRLSVNFISDLQEWLQECIEKKRDQNNQNNSFHYVDQSVKKNEVTNNHLENFHESIQELYPLQGESIIPSFTYRKEQEIYSSKIFEALTTNEHALFEAETGVGKRLGYLFPALYFALLKKEKVLISVYTYELEQQILFHEIPILEKKLAVKTAVVKHKKDYLNIRLFEKSLLENEKNYDSLLTKAQILIWLNETNTGEKSELNLSSGGNSLWDRINASVYHEDSKSHPVKDFYLEAQKKAQTAQLVITSHSMLVEDMEANFSLLPNYQYAIIDEAHHLNKVVLTTIGEKLQYKAVMNQIQRLLSMRRTTDLSETSRIESFLEEFNYFFTTIHQFVTSAITNKDLNVVKYRVNGKSDKAWMDIKEQAKNMSIRIAELLVIVNNQQETSSNYLLKRHLLNVKEYLVQFFLQKKLNEVKWIEAEKKGAKNAVTLCKNPIFIDHLLANSLFSNKRSVILTSATMTIKNCHQFMIEKLGLKDFYPLTLKLPNPNSKRMKLLIPSEIPSVKELDVEEFSQWIAYTIEELIPSFNKVFVLFPSYEPIKRNLSYA